MSVLILCGHKGVGKTSLGLRLSQSLKCDFLDTDREIEHLFKLKYSLEKTCYEIYESFGEDFFRTIEHEVISSLSFSSKAIISIGAGAFLVESNHPFLLRFQLLELKREKQKLYELAMQRKIAYIDSKNFDSSFEQAYYQRELIFKKIGNPFYMIDEFFVFEHFLEFIKRTYAF